MTFFIEKKLALGPIRFGVTLRKTTEAIDDNPQLSTGPGGEFVRRRGEGFFFGGNDRFDAPVLKPSKTISSTPFWTSMKAHRGLLALAVLGIIFVLLGFAVIVRKGPAGWVNVTLGIAMIATPIVMTAKERKKIHEREESERAEREAIEARNREMLAGFSAALERVQRERTDEAFDLLERERTSFTLPYELWSMSARRAVLLIGFDELVKLGVSRSKEVAALMARASRAAGLTSEDENGAKLDLYRAVVWHLLADDRMGPVQEELLLMIRKGFDIWDRDVPAEAQAIDEFQRLRGITTANLPRPQCTTTLAFHEYCVHQSQSLHVTNKNLIVEGKKRVDHALASLSDITASVDEQTITLRDANEKKPLRLKVEDAIYTAAMLDIALAIDERPKGFA